MKINEVIVVEGKNDIAAVKKAVDAFCVSTSGSGINMEKINFLKKLEKERGIIVLMDPDGPGEKIRAIINEHIPNVKHAFIKKADALHKEDVGIENASEDSIRASLKNVISSNKKTSDLEMSDLIKHNLILKTNSKQLRFKLDQHLNIGHCNGKTLLKRLKMINLNKVDLDKIMGEVNGK